MKDIQIHKTINWKYLGYTVTSCAKVKNYNLKTLSNNVSAILTSENSAEFKNLRRNLSYLEDAALIDLFSSPHLAQFVRQMNTESTIDFIKNAFSAEKCRNGESDCFKEVWGGFGESMFFGNKLMYSAPVVHGIAIDFCSPFYDIELSGKQYRKIISPKSYFDEYTKTNIAKKIKCALDFLKNVDPICFAFVTSSLSVIMPRIDESEELFKGSSNAHAAGKMNLYNAHLEYINETNVLSSLIHEAIHQFIFSIEQVYPILVNVDDESKCFIKSPWSGAKLDLTTYVHACYVWFSLANFWRAPSTSDYFSKQYISIYLERAFSGFQYFEMLNRLEPYEQKIRPSIYRELTEIQSMILELDIPHRLASIDA